MAPCPPGEALSPWRPTPWRGPALWAPDLRKDSHREVGLRVLSGCNEQCPVLAMCPKLQPYFGPCSPVSRCS
ncbi:hypothetical protein FKM82_026798 [Ascaphus truei]